jgi:hypothetical protein
VGGSQPLARVDAAAFSAEPLTVDVIGAEHLKYDKHDHLTPEVPCPYLVTLSLDSTGTGRAALEAGLERVLDHLRRPVPGRRDVLTRRRKHR